MRQFTQAEKQQLQTKIDDQERKQRIVGKIIRNNKEAKSTGPIDAVWKYGFLVIILCLLGLNIFIHLYSQRYSSNQHITVLNLVIVLMLLVNHIAFHFTKRGWLNPVLKTIAGIMTAVGLAYAVYVYRLTVLAV